MRTKIDGPVVPLRPEFYIPPVETLAKTREVANAFATFFGIWIMKEMVYIQTNTALYCDIHGSWHRTLSMGGSSRKVWALLYPAAKILGLTKNIVVKAICSLSMAVINNKVPIPRPLVEGYHLLLDQKDTDENPENPWVSGNANYHFQSNVPLLQFLHTFVKDRDETKIHIGEWVGHLDKEQAELMLKAMAASSTNTLNTIESVSRLLCTDIDNLCKIADYSYECEGLGDRLWVFTIKKNTVDAVAAARVVTEDIENPA